MNWNKLHNFAVQLLTLLLILFKMTKQILLAAVGTICLSPCFADGTMSPWLSRKRPYPGRITLTLLPCTLLKGTLTSRAMSFHYRFSSQSESARLLLPTRWVNCTWMCSIQTVAFFKWFFLVSRGYISSQSRREQEPFIPDNSWSSEMANRR